MKKTNRNTKLLLQKMLIWDLIPDSALRTIISMYDPVVRVTAADIAYQDPFWMKERIHPELNIKLEFDVTKLKRWRHPDQTKCSGDIVYEKMKATGLLKNSLGKAELLAISRRGPDFFRQHFPGKAELFGWRDISLHCDNFILVPLLCINCNNEVVLEWNLLTEVWGSRRLALVGAEL